MQFYDKGEISTREITDEGYLKVGAFFARSGVQTYVLDEIVKDRSELPEPLRSRPAGAVVRLLRPDSEVFKDESLNSYTSKPVTNGHPQGEFVDAQNVKRLQVGISGESVRKEGVRVAGSLLIQDAGAVSAAQSGKEELSAGYRADMDWSGGVDPIHGAFDAVQRNIRVNHIALVEHGRAGSAVRLKDEKTEGNKMATEKRTVGGVTVEFSDQGAQVIDKLQGDLSASQELCDEATKERDDLKARLSEAEGKLEAEKANKLTDEAIDSLVKTRVELIDGAKKLHTDLDATGKSPREIKEEVITHCLKDAADLEGKDDHFVDGLYSGLVAQGPKKTTAEQFADGVDKGQEVELTDSQKALAARNEARVNAWKGGK